MVRRRVIVLLLGDLVTLGLVTAFGFATHGELGTAGIRMMTTYLPLSAAWILVSPHLGAYNLEWMGEPKNLWRPVWATVIAGPLAAWIRGIWLNRPIMPVFVAVLVGVSAAAILIWRGIYWLISSRVS